MCYLSALESARERQPPLMDFQCCLENNSSVYLIGNGTFSTLQDRSLTAFFFLSVCPRVTCRRSMLCCLWLQFHRLCDMVQYRVQAFCIGYKHDQSSRFKINWLSYPRNYKHGILNMQILRHVATGVAPLVIMSICSNLTCH